MSSERTCMNCGKRLPLTEENFHKSKDGFHARCKGCRNAHEKKGRKKKTNAKLDQIEKGAVDLFLASAKIGGANIPHSSELLEVLMEYFGGARGFANAYMKQFFDAPQGGAFRTKMLDTVVRLVSANTAMGGAKKPLTLWSEDELDQELQKRLMETVIVNPVRVEHVPMRGVPVVSLLDGNLGGMSAVPSLTGGPDHVGGIPTSEG